MTTFKRRTGQADSLVQSVLVEAVTKSQSKTQISAYGDSLYFVCSLTKNYSQTNRNHLVHTLNVLSKYNSQTHTFQLKGTVYTLYEL